MISNQRATRNLVRKSNLSSKLPNNILKNSNQFLLNRKNKF